MPYKSISELKDSMKDKDVYVLGSGASIDFYPEKFFKGKILIGMNFLFKRFDLSYCVCTHHAPFVSGIDKTKFIVSEIDPDETGGSSNIIESKHDYWTFKIGTYSDFEKNLEDIGSNEILCFGNSIVISTINFAAHIGAKNIFLVGVDCCVIDKKTNFEGYPRGLFFENNNQFSEQRRMYLNDFYLRNMKEVSILRDSVISVYGCSIVSVSPFVGLKNENKRFIDKISETDLKKLEG